MLSNFSTNSMEAAEIQALTKLDVFQTRIGKIEFAWYSCIKCCDSQIL